MTPHPLGKPMAPNVIGKTPVHNEIDMHDIATNFDMPRTKTTSFGKEGGVKIFAAEGAPAKFIESLNAIAANGGSMGVVAGFENKL